jgi:hypothetical protein
MASGSPLARMKEQFGGKDKLVDKLVGLVDAGDESKDDLRRRLLGAANKKLLRLFGVATKVKEHGGHDKIAAVAAEGVGHGKDKDYVAKLESYSNGRLVDMVVTAERRAKRKSAAPAKAVAKTAAVKAAAIAAKVPKTKAAKAKPTTSAKGSKPKSGKTSGKSK